MLHRNPFRGFGATEGRNLPFLIALAIGFYNSLDYRPSRDFSIGNLWSGVADVTWQWL